MSCNYICPTPIEQEIEDVPATGYDPFYFPAEGDLLAFFFTEQTFLQVLSALMNGSQLTYGAEGRQVLWYFLQNVEFPVTICAKIIDCITNDEDVRHALADWLATDPAATNVIQGIVNAGGPITGGGTVILTADDDDALFGACTFLIDTMHDAIVDFNQLAEVGTNTRERANIILQAIPGFGDAIAAIPEYVDEVFTDVIEVFEAQYTTTPKTGSRDRLRCGVFCLARTNDRTLTWDLIETYFWNLVSFESTTLNLALDFVGFLVTGSWAGQDVVNISFAQMATAMSVGNKFGTQTFPNLQVVMKLGLNNPDSDWRTLCEDCPPTPRYPLITGIPASFPDQVNTFFGYDGDYDLWDITTSDCPMTVMMDNGQTYTHGYNVGIDNGSGGFVNATITDDVTDGNTDWCLWLDHDGALLNARHFPFTSGPGVVIAQGCTTGIVTCRVKVKPR